MCRVVIISHAGDDAALARRIARAIEDAGHTIVLDLTGTAAQADVVLSLITEESLASPRCAADLDRARERRVPVIPVRLPDGPHHPLWSESDHVVLPDRPDRPPLNLLSRLRDVEPDQHAVPEPQLDLSVTPPSTSGQSPVGRSDPGHDGGRRWARLAGSVGVVAALGALAAVGVSFRGAGEESDQATALRAEQLVQQTTEALRTDPQLALQQALAAYALKPDADAEGALDAVLSTPFGQASTLTRGADWGRALAISPDGMTVAVAGDAGQVGLWDLPDGASAAQRGDPLIGHTGEVISLAFAPDGRTLATGGSDGKALLWSLGKDGTASRHDVPLPGRGWVSSLAFSPDGTTLAAGRSDHTITLWNVEDPQAATLRGAPLQGHGGWVYSVAFSPDGATLASGSSDATIVLWDTADPEAVTRRGDLVLGHTGWIYAVAFSPDGATLASGSSDRTVILWDISDLNLPVQRGEPLRGTDGSIRSVAMSPDGHALAAAGSDGVVLVWDIRDANSPRQNPSLLGHRGWVSSVAYSPDSSLLASTGSDGTTLLWNVGERPTLFVGTVAERACARLGEGLTRQEWQSVVGDMPFRRTCPET